MIGGSSEAVGLTTLRLTMMQIENTFRVIGPQLLVIPWDCSPQHHIRFLDRILDTQVTARGFEGSKRI
jgi:hypothetical protein